MNRGSTSVRIRPYKTEAVVLRTIPYAETSQVVHISTPDHGLVAALAKGARRPGPALQGGLALGTIGEAWLAPRRGAELELLRRFRLRDQLRGLSKDLQRFHAACYVLDLMRAWMRPALPNTALHRAGLAALRAAAKARPLSLPAWIAWFEARAVTAAGHRPRLTGCAVCGRGDAPGTVFSPLAGGTVHPECVPVGPRLRLPDPARRALERVYQARVDELAAEPLNSAEIREIRAVHDLLIPHLLERRPATLANVPRPRT